MQQIIYTLKMNKENRQVSNSKKPKYNYLQIGQNNQLHKVYISPQKRQKSMIFNTRNSIQEFSPYRNNHDQIKNKNYLIQDVMLENQLLTQQLNQYRNVTLRLQSEIRQKNQAYLHLTQTLSTQQKYYQTVIQEMKKQIQVLLSKNLILETDINRLSDIKNKSRIMDNHKEQLKKEQLTFRDQISQLIFNHDKDKNRKNNQIKQSLEGLLKRQSTLQEFNKSIMQMYRRIQGEQINDLKSLWKWLKMLGQQHNYFNKVKKPLANYLHISADQSFSEIMQKLFRDINIVS